MFGTGKDPCPSIPKVRFDRSRVTEAVKADLWTAVQEYEDLPLGEERAIYEAALEGISRGRDLAFIAKAMTDRGVSQRRAGEISRYLTNRAMSIMDRDRLMALCITEARWLWSGACDVDGHKAATGKTYDPRSGLKIARRRTIPGREPGCSCVGIPMVPGFD
jgi:hypothetical protein